MRPNIVCVYLAAGSSRRMGCSKLALPLHGKPLGMWALEEALASMVRQVIVVLAEDGDDSWLHQGVKEHTPDHIRLVYCQDARLGQSYSLRSGIAAAEQAGAEAAIVMLGDQPLVTAELLNQLIGAYRQDGSLDFIAAGDGHLAKPPILFSSRAFPRLLELKGDQGARRLIDSEFLCGHILPCTDSRVFTDVDTKQEYQALRHESFPAASSS